MEKLGEGSFGTVFKAKDITNGKMCAIKLLMNCFSTNYVARKIYREIKLMRKLCDFDNKIYVPEIY